MVNGQTQLNYILDVVTKRIQALLGNYLHSVILYGSYARGDYDAESDIDIMVLADIKESEIRLYQQKINKIASDVGLENDVFLNIFLKNKTSFEKRIPILPFYQNVINEGVTVYAYK